MAEKLYIAMVGLPARGKSTVSLRLCEGLKTAGVSTKIFNNGNIRREILGKSSAMPTFYHPDNHEGIQAREHIALLNMHAAKNFLAGGGMVAILDATNAGRSRRELLEKELNNAPLLYIECVNDDQELEEACVKNKAMLPEFSHLDYPDAVAAFQERINYYRSLLIPLDVEPCFIRVDTIRNTIIEEKLAFSVPYYINIRDILVSEWVKDLYLARHGESLFNIEGRIGGDSSLTDKGEEQARALAQCFNKKYVPYIFTSCKQRSLQTAAPLAHQHSESRCISLPELDEIDAGICDSMRYEDIRHLLPHVHTARSNNKYYYSYPDGEGYASMKERVEHGFRKALFLSGGQKGIIIIGHQAVNRMILSLFLFRKTEDVPYIFVPQTQYYHIVATHQKKLFELKSFVTSQ